MRLLALFALTALAAACSSASSSADSDSSDVIAQERGEAICKFPKRTYSRALADHYIQWSSDAERETYLAGYLPAMGLQRSTETAPLPRLQEFVDQLFPAIRAELPFETEGLNKPPTVVLLDSPLTNAFAAGDGRENPIRAPWLLFVNTGLLTSNPPDAEVKGVMAHELAHLMAKHQFPDAPERVRRYYTLGDRNEKDIVSSLEKDDAKVRAFADKYESMVAYAGGFEAPVLKGFPVKFTGIQKPIRYHVMFETLGSLPTQECTAFGQKYAAFQESLRSKLSKFDHQLHIAASDEAAVSAAAAETEQAGHACVTSAESAGGVTFVDLVAQFELRTHPERVQELQSAGSAEALRRLILDADELAIDDGAGDAVTKLLKAGAKKQNALTTFGEAGIDGIKMSSMRRYAEEAEADQIAVRVLRRAGVDVDGGAAFLLRSMDPAARAQCDQALSRGEIPPFGGFSFLHPATCWRVFQARQFAAKLDTTCAAQ